MFFRLLFIIFPVIVLTSVSRAEPTAAEAEQRGAELRKEWKNEASLDETKLKNNGVRRLNGKYISLYTDLPSAKAIDELPLVFDQIIPLLCRFFELDVKNYEHFNSEVFLIDDIEKFKPSGAVRRVPNLRHGYAFSNRVWLRKQPSEYYQRHLLIHEGVHSFMNYAFGDWGPPWYREGTAEFCGTHRWKNGKLTLGVFPDDKAEFPGWGRIEMIQHDSAEKKAKSFRDIFLLKAEDYDENDAYAWSWLFAAFCRHRSEFLSAYRRIAWQLNGSDRDIEQRFLALVKQRSGGEKALRQIENDWQDFVANVQYGYDFKRTRIQYSDSPSVLAEKKTVKVTADRGWQGFGMILEKGKTYKITASGRFSLNTKPKIWYSEANGITLQYYRGLPIGTLIVSQDTHLSSPQSIGLETIWTAKDTSEIFFRINDFPSDLENNGGEIEVNVERMR